jgi:hypothetical protein
MSWPSGGLLRQKKTFPFPFFRITNSKRLWRNRSHHHHHHNHHHHSLPSRHSSSACSHNSAGLTHQALFILSSDCTACVVSLLWASEWIKQVGDQICQLRKKCAFHKASLRRQNQNFLTHKSTVKFCDAWSKFRFVLHSVILTFFSLQTSWNMQTPS